MARDGDKVKPALHLQDGVFLSRLRAKDVAQRAAPAAEPILGDAAGSARQPQCSSGMSSLPRSVVMQMWWKHSTPRHLFRLLSPSKQRR